MRGFGRKLVTIAAFVLLSVSALACGPQLLSRVVSPTETRSAAQGAEVVIVYSRSGGIARVNEEWTVYSDGRIVDIGGKERQVSAAAVADVLRQAEEAGFFEFSPKGPGNNLCNDCFNYRLSITSTGERHEVELIDAQEGVPDGIWALILSVQQLASPTR